MMVLRAFYAGTQENIRTAFMAELMQRLLVSEFNVYYYRWKFQLSDHAPFTTLPHIMKQVTSCVPR